MSFSLGRVSLSCLCLILAVSRAKAPSSSIWKEFSGDKALAHVQRLVDFGPRPPESEAIEKSRNYIKQELKSSGWNVSEQTFTDNTPRGQGTMLGIAYLTAIPLAWPVELVWLSLPIAWLVCLVISYVWMKSRMWQRLQI